MLTGILKQDLGNMLVGSAPFVITIPTTVLAGALQLRKNEGPTMEAAASTMLLVASLFQAGCLLMALVAVEEVSNEHREALLAQEPDVEVMTLEEAAAATAEVYEATTEWARLPWAAKLLLLVEALLMGASVALMGGASKLCWEPVELLPQNATLGPINGPPLDGSVLSLARPHGRVALAMHLGALLLHLLVFNTWARAAFNKRVQRGGSEDREAMDLGSFDGEAVPKPGVGSNGQAIKRHNSRDGFEYVTNPVRGRSMSADSAGSSSSRSPRRLASKDSAKAASGLTKKLSEDFLPVT